MRAVDELSVRVRRLALGVRDGALTSTRDLSSVAGKTSGPLCVWAKWCRNFAASSDWTGISGPYVEATFAEHDIHVRGYMPCQLTSEQLQLQRLANIPTSPRGRQQDYLPSDNVLQTMQLRNSRV